MVDRLTVGSMAKVTLANNATMYPDLLLLLKSMTKYQTEEIAKPLAEVIQAAETAQAPRLKKEALAAIDELKRKGPGHRREMTVWGYVGQGTIAVTCITLAVVSLHGGRHPLRGRRRGDERGAELLDGAVATQPSPAML